MFGATSFEPLLCPTRIFKCLLSFLFWSKMILDSPARGSFCYVSIHRLRCSKWKHTFKQLSNYILCNQATAHHDVRQSSVGGLLTRCLVTHTENTSRELKTFHFKSRHISCSAITYIHTSGTVHSSIPLHWVIW